jgi:hypothetical protein
MLWFPLVVLLIEKFGQLVDAVAASVPIKSGLPDDITRLPKNSQSVDPLTPSQIIFLNTVTNVQQPGIHGARNQFGLHGSQTPRITAQNLHEIDWTQIDRRTEDG